MLYNSFKVLFKAATINDKGDSVTAREQVLVCACSFTDAEVRTTKIVGNRLLNIVKIEGKNFKEVFDNADGEHFYEVTLKSQTEDKKGNIKVSKSDYLVRANDLDEAKTLFKKHINILPGEDIVSIKESKITEYYPL